MEISWSLKNQIGTWNRWICYRVLISRASQNLLTAVFRRYIYIYIYIYLYGRRVREIRGRGKGTGRGRERERGRGREWGQETHLCWTSLWKEIYIFVCIYEYICEHMYTNVSIYTCICLCRKIRVWQEPFSRYYHTPCTLPHTRRIRFHCCPHYSRQSTHQNTEYTTVYIPM